METKETMGRHLPLKVKLTYSSSNIAKSIFGNVTAMYMVYFYTEVCGLNGVIIASIILASKIWDIINDPMMGAIVDSTVSKEGKCRFYLKYFSVPAGIILALNFFMPDASMTVKYVWVTLTYVLASMGSTSLLIPLNALIGRLTDHPVERAHLNQFSGIFSVLTGLFVQGYTMRLVSFAGDGDFAKGFLYVGIFYGALYAIFHLVAFFGTKGYEPCEERLPADGSKTEKQSLKAVMTALLKNKYWLLCIVINFACNLAMAVESGVAVFYYQYNHGDMGLLSMWASMAMLPAAAAYVVMGILVKKLGNSGTSIFGAACAVLGYGLRFLLQDGSLPVMVIGWVLAGFGTGLISSTIILNIFDAKVYGEWKTGVKNDAILMSGFSVSYKIGMALGGRQLCQRFWN
ncbi:MFS transporter [Ihubacter sp. rT4E-8]|uniref:MFS transporter n=1 Tax=Ihubacter sp. rT4E-8 TaxID=3242369 RepID=UPI003CF1E77D